MDFISHFYLPSKGFHSFSYFVSNNYFNRLITFKIFNVFVIKSMGKSIRGCTY
jgi:hypothetical protein